MMALFWIILISLSAATGIYFLARKIGDNYRYNKGMVLAEAKQLCNKSVDTQTASIFQQFIEFGLEQEARDIFAKNNRNDLIEKLDQYIAVYHHKFNQDSLVSP